MRISRVLLTAALITMALSACGGGGGESGDSSTSSESTGSEKSDKKQGRIAESGFGQAQEYVWVTALVENLSDHGGQTVTVNFNVLDRAGEVLGSQSQIESFNLAGQSVAVGTQIDLEPRMKAASVEATLLVEDQGTFEESEMDLGTFKADTIKVDPYDPETWHAKFTVQNVTDKPLQSPRIGVICKNAAGKIIGGGIDYPDLVPASGKVVIDPFLITAGKPAECKAYAAAGM